MKIEKLILENFIGVYAGMGKKRIEIDFANNSNEMIMLLGSNGSGKAQPNNAKVYTPEGYKLMGEIKVGDKVMSEKGKPTNVVGVYPQGKKETYRIKFNDGTYLDTAKDHLFKVLELSYRKVNGKNKKYYRESIKSIEELMKGRLYNGNTLRYYIPMCEPVNFNDQDVFIDPYILGCLLADGSLRTNAVRFTKSNEPDIVEKVRKRLDDEYKLSLYRYKDRADNYSIVKKEKSSRRNRYGKEIKSLGLFGKKSEDKFIPDIYKFNSVEKRLNLLRGLIDCDGSIEKGNSIYYYTSSEQLANDVKFLVESLGGTAKIHEKNTTFSYKEKKKKGLTSYRVFIKKPTHMEFFSSKKHKERFIQPSMYKEPHRKIKSIEKLSIEQEMTCIMVDNPEHLYLTENFIVTHNTVIMSNLNPYRITNDSRRDIILENEKGYKEIHYRKDNNDLYVIKHYYKSPSSGKNLSFIEKNGEELNENGGIRLFEGILEEELEVTKDYFTVGRLGDNVSNFIDYTTAERKKYINKFVPDIDDYMAAFKTVESKHREMRNSIRSLNLDLEKYHAFEDIVDEKEKLEGTVNTINDNISNSKDKRSRIDSEIKSNYKKIEDLFKENHPESDYKEIENRNDINFIIETIDSEINEYNKELQTLSRLIEDNENLSNYTIDSAKEKINVLNNAKDISVTKIESLESSINDYNDRIGKNKEELRKLNGKINSYSTSDPDILYERKKQLDEIKESFEKEIEELFSKFDYSHDQYDSLMKDSDKVNSIIYKHHPNIQNILDHIHDKRDQSSIDEYVSISTIEEKVSLLNNEMINLKNNNTTLEAKRMDIIKNSSLLDILEVSEHHEHAKDCPFVPMAMGYEENEYSNLSSIESELERNNNRIIEIDNNIEQYGKDIEYLKSINEVISIDGSMDIFSVGKDKVINMIINTDNSGLLEKYNNDISILNDINKTFENLESIKKNISDIENNITSANDDKKYIDLLKENMNKLEVSIDEDTIKLEESMKERRNHSARIHKATQNIDIINEYLEIKNNSLDYEEKIEKLTNLRSTINNDIMTVINRNITDILELNKYIEEQNQSYDIMKNKLDSVNKDYIIVDNTIQKLNNLEEKYSTVKRIYEALDPKKGIPLIFIENYLKDIAVRTNELLSIAYNDNFKIDFEVTDSDFFIKVYKSDGTILSDIKDASQGETNMTNISLSLALLERVTEGYNILYLDEVDATLDENNRRRFINVIDNQIDKLGINQTFIISHNNEFFSSNIDMILLDGYQDKIDITDDEFMKNKNIIYQNSN